MTNAQPEPSMEEILASIRRIISEDEEDHPGVDRSGLDTTQQAADDAAPPLAPVLDDTPEISDQDATLTKMLDMAESRRLAEASNHTAEPVDLTPHGGESDTNHAPEHQEEITVSPIAEVDFDEDEAGEEITTEDVKMVKQHATALRDTDDDIVDATTASAAAAAFSNLSRSVRVSDGEGQTLEAIVTDMMRPLVKEWLDQNLTRIVEEKVEYEVQRLARRG